MVTNILGLIIRNAVTEPKVVRTVEPRMLHTTETGCTENGGETSAYGMFLGKPIGKRQLGRPKMRWEGNVKINLDT
jgi:hypothetical protein